MQGESITSASLAQPLGEPPSLQKMPILPPSDEPHHAKALRVPLARLTVEPEQNPSQCDRRKRVTPALCSPVWFQTGAAANSVKCAIFCIRNSYEKNIVVILQYQHWSGHVRRCARHRRAGTNRAAGHRTAACSRASTTAPGAKPRLSQVGSVCVSQEPSGRGAAAERRV